MTPVFVVEIVTPKKIALNGLWFGPKKPKRVIIWVHGMLSSAFSMRHIVRLLADKETAVLTFNNRGFESVTDVKQIAGKKRKWIRAGTAQEVFTDSSDDINGAVRLAKKSGAKELFLVGHSTGCQKSVYWAYKNKNSVKGIILLGPLSDYAGARTDKRFDKTFALAKRMIAEKRSHELLPANSYWHYADPQRFISLYTPDSIEQSIFPYFDGKRPAKSLSSIRTPMLLIFAGDDEYADRPVVEIIDWFEKHTHAPLVSLVTKKGGHSFHGSEEVVAKAIKAWIVKK